MKKVFHSQQKPLSRTDDLREKLDQLNALIGGLGHGTGRNAFKILELFDETRQAILELRSEGHPLPAEEALFEEISAHLRRKARTFLREIGGSKELRQRRAERDLKKEHWWWYLDKWYAERRKRIIRRTLLQVLGAVAVLILLVIAYQHFFTPDRNTQARMEYQEEVIGLNLQGDYSRALELVEKALSSSPEDPELLLLKAIILENLGDTDEAERSFAEIESLLGDRLTFHLKRAQSYLILDMPEKALQDAENVLEVHPDSAEGTLVLAETYESLERYEEAIRTYERASQLAGEQDKPELSVIARIRMGQLLLIYQSNPQE